MGKARQGRHGSTKTNMMLRTLLALGIAVATADMTCPSTSAVLACGMKVTTTASASCADVLAEMKARIAGQYGAWHDPHNNGTYKVESYGGTFSTSRLTGDGKYTDKQIFTLTDQSGACLIEACSRSQVFSIGDAGTNYCDLKMLFCGSKDGCKPVNHDFAAGKETTSKFSQASVDMGSCLKVSEAQVPVGRGCGFSCKTASDCTSGGCGVCDDGFCQAQATVTELAGAAQPSNQQLPALAQVISLKHSVSSTFGPNEINAFKGSITDIVSKGPFTEISVLQVTTKLDEHIVPEEEFLPQPGRGLHVLQDSLDGPQSKITTLSFKVTLPDGASKTDLLEASKRLRKSAETSALCRKLAAQWSDALDCTQNVLLSDDVSQFAMQDGDDKHESDGGDWSGAMIAGFVISMALI